MKLLIQDEFSGLSISRQRKYQLRRARDRRCTQCGKPVVKGTRCLKHLIDARERQRKSQGLKRRYYGTLSYKLAELKRSPCATKPSSRKGKLPERTKATAPSSTRTQGRKLQRRQAFTKWPGKALRFKTALNPARSRVAASR